MNYQNGILFDEKFQKELKEKFYYADADPIYGKRLFFENSGGSLRLRKCVEAKTECEQFPDCPERIHERSLYLKGLVEKGTKEILEILFGAKSGALITELTASQTMFHMVGLIMENIPGTNAVVSSIEHPSAYDAIEYYCKKTGKEMRVVPANPKTGGIDPETVLEYVDENTCLLSIMSASNISGNIMDIESIVSGARRIKPDLYIISDAVQHAPHHSMDVEKLQIDGMNFAPYKFFGVRGCGFAYVSDRVAALPHHKLIAKEQKVFELGTSAPGNFAAALEIINYVCDIGKAFIEDTDRRSLYNEGMRRIHLHERALLYRMLEGTDKIPGLRHIPGVTVCVDTEDITNRDLIAAIAIDNIGMTDCVAEYQKRGVTVYERVDTSIYSKRILEALGLKGAIRVSPLHCHGTDDIDKFLLITAEIAGFAKNIVAP
ncbi:MAG: aminotransferase class V-fold PLP-dependent enzyme [Ruminococcaceae bacterium]|nr:aminotransferase class V-fold PLP-dependent enzyme [Oscillospiraceae bacterium]